MRLESDGDGLPAVGMAALNDSLHDVLVRPVHAVKVADTDDGRPEIAWHFFEFAKNLQSNS